MIETFQAPAFSGLVREVLCLIELPRLLLRFPSLFVQPRGKREPILIFPPHGSGDGATTILKGYLRLIGYRARGWGLGRNNGSITDLMPRALKRLASFAKRSNQKVTLIGWSFGGYLARELARERPDLVCQVITLGTPVIGGPKYTALSELYRKRGMDIEAIAAEVDFRNQAAPLETPVIAIYSRIDALVAWQACIDHQTPNVEHVEIRSTHYGFGFSPEVYRIIAQRLAQAHDRSRYESGEKSQRRKHIRLHAR
jgi:hypothetical protein